jgi:hypothetical protein
MFTFVLSTLNQTTMKKTFSISVIFILFMASAYSQYVLQKDYIELHQQGTSLYSITYKNLRIVPLFAGSAFQEAHKNVGNYKTLKESLDSGLVEIKESGSEATTIQNQIHTSNDDLQVQQYQQNYSSSGNVNQLVIRNLTNDTLFIMAGELVSGGKQDRVIAENILLPPGKEFVPLPVFCVEHGRWNANTDDGNSFKQHRSFVGNSVRSKAVQNADQSAVWSQVSEVTKKNNSQSGTDNFNAVYSNKEFMEEFNSYSGFFKTSFGSISNCIGFVGISGNKIVGCDIFATSELFYQQFESLVAAYITEAITVNETPSLKDNEIQDYLKSFLTASENQDEMIQKKGKSFEHNGNKLHIATF